MQVEITSKSAYTIEFRATSETELTKDDIWNAQAQKGYHPNGYGGPNKIKPTKEGNTFIYTWECSGSCD